MCMKILIVFTGGTIGCTEKNGVADVDSATCDRIAAICAKLGQETELAFPYNMLSENADCGTLSKLASFMLSIDYEKYGGVIVTHGSDTLAYTANLLSAALSWISIPVIITAANYVMTDKRSNAEDNLHAACAFIEESAKQGRGGVFAAWKNDVNSAQIHLASRLLESDAFGNFESFGGRPFARLDGERFEYAPDQEAIRTNTLAFLKNRRITLKNNVALIHSYVGLDYGTLNIKGKDAVLLKLYHSGTACMTGERTAFKNLAEMCRSENADLYITPARRDTYVYGSSKGFNSTAAIPLYGMSEYRAYTLLLLAYSLEGADRRAVLGLESIS